MVGFHSYLPILKDTNFSFTVLVKGQEPIRVNRVSPANSLKQKGK